MVGIPAGLLRKRAWDMENMKKTWKWSNSTITLRKGRLTKLGQVVHGYQGGVFIQWKGPLIYKRQSLERLTVPTASRLSGLCGIGVLNILEIILK
ncbi:hypothetical protein AMECASPLE_005280 [Ameca splendens]|uniref:Uncharacterized protein n=1 Tax=Ameca splendens TaxID=208324 RepID=A0ABV0YXA0_9TELE